ncbi:MAG: hypothetical protein Q8M01_03610 [Rubrivivax sp.]|nr:hypothetical protein [Rubrivivax sp.]
MNAMLTTLNTVQLVLFIALLALFLPVIFCAVVTFERGHRCAASNRVGQAGCR